MAFYTDNFAKPVKLSDSRVDNAPKQTGARFILRLPSGTCHEAILDSLAAIFEQDSSREGLFPDVYGCQYVDDPGDGVARFSHSNGETAGWYRLHDGVRYDKYKLALPHPARKATLFGREFEEQEIHEEWNAVVEGCVGELDLGEDGQNLKCRVAERVGRDENVSGPFESHLLPAMELLL